MSIMCGKLHCCYQGTVRKSKLLLEEPCPHPIQVIGKQNISEYDFLVSITTQTRKEALYL